MRGVRFLWTVFWLAPALAGAAVLVEAESFANRGGWVLDSQFVEVMGSPYLLAHGLGRPVAAAQTSATLPTAGVYRVWARTRDWIPDHPNSPGRFRIAIDGGELAPDFGTVKGDWAWQDGGLVTAATAAVTLEPRDLTGFDGRCDAVCFAGPGEAAPPAGGTALTAWRRAVRGEPDTPEVSGAYDFVVTGGGLAGCAAAIAAARAGLSVALIQDRPYYGGNASEDIRVQPQGATRHAIVGLLLNSGANGSAATTNDDVARQAAVDAEPNIHQFTQWRAYGVVTNAAHRITAVDARHVASGERRRFYAPIFADCTGDAWIGYWAGAVWRMGRESHAEFGETLATNADALTMGSTLMWSTTTAPTNTPFPAVPWALSVAGSAANTSGGWDWEYGLNLNTIADAEQIRDYLLRAIYGNFYNAHQSDPTRVFSWVPYVAGKRESRRLMGDYILIQGDSLSNAFFEDAIGTATWPIDLHYPSTPAYRATSATTNVPQWYIPFRSLYSTNVPNLMMAGRCLSVTHVGLGSPRVMRTCGQMGVAVGYAASLCRKYGCDPRDIYRDPARTEELRALIGGYFPPYTHVSAIVDNTDAACTLTGTWTPSTSVTGYYGTNYLTDGNAGKGTKAARFALNPPADGTYGVCVRWTSGTNRATNAPVEIAHADGTNTVYVDQSANSGSWVNVGAWRFLAGQGSVTVRNTGTILYVIADAVGLQGSSFADSDGDGLPDDWERWFFFSRTRANSAADDDHDGVDNLDEYLAGTDPTSSNSVFRVTVRPTADGHVVVEWPSASNRLYRVDVSTNLAVGFNPEADNVPATPPLNVHTSSMSGVYRVRAARP